MNILVLNAGSSSHKSCLYRLDKAPPQSASGLPPEPLWQAQIDWQQSPPLLTALGAGGHATTLKLTGIQNRSEAVARMLHTLHEGETAVLSGLQAIDAVGHRVVHGAQQYQKSVWIDDAVKAAIAELIPLAPAHNPANLEGIQSIDALFGDIPQYAVFDTAFHSQMPDVAAYYPIPQDWTAQGIRRYGFHGISHQYCADRAAQLLHRPLPELRLVIGHLGNGCSLSAVKGGRSIDTTMGFTPLEGLMMGTRSGSIDPGILTYLLREKGYTHEQLDHQLNKASGLKGVSGLSGNMRELLAAMKAGNASAQLAVDMFIYRLTAQIAAMTASLGGIDGLIFTGGVGENAPYVRAEACASLAFLNLAVSAEKNQQGQGDRIISTDSSAVSILVIHTQEDWQIAKEYWQLTASAQSR
ncbi:MAG: acetate kinase [Phormidesmis sp. RL_2_1]|nr:acetate kinase [Phormidesmis sp. RL_2_1]